MMTVRDIQEALNRLGFDTGPIDGIRGRLTIKAIKEFQRSKNLIGDGIVGPRTRAALFKANDAPISREFDIPVSMPWLETAFDLIGTREKPGAGSNEAILGWAEDLDLFNYHDDDIPWCGLFTAHCIASQLPEEVIPTSPLTAQNWKNFGREVSPRLGATMVFWRESKDSWKGHVGFYWAEDDHAYHILGGNQSNSVNIKRIVKNRLISARWPITSSDIDAQIRFASPNGMLISQNEA
ncbi:TIGR02594 family protein [Microbulbifer sp. CnH-101-E]|uniref:NlpC/P60 family protein n=1 Tax=unclassified Microbulbifer TaxID=2619833 RepID=UPI004039E34D